MLADGEVDPVYRQISKLKGDPISAGCLRTYTSLPRFPMVRLHKDVLDLYGLRRDDSERANEVQTSLRVQPVEAG